MNPSLPVSAEPLVVLAQLVISGANFDRLTHEAVCATAMDLEADLCEILRIAPDSEEFFRVASFEVESERKAHVIPGGIASVAGYTLLCGTPVVSEDLRKERRFGRTGALSVDGPVSAVAAPMPGRRETCGVLVAYAARASAFEAGQALSVSRMASLLGGALERLEERDELRRAAKGPEVNGVVPHPIHEHVSGNGDHGLTGRQVDVLRLLADGRPAKRIASDMGISIHTVHFHQRNLYRSLGASSSTGAIKRARELGLL